MVARILVVDDDQGLLHLICARLVTAGYEVTQATSGEMALEVFRQQRPQLVVTDLKMGEMDGMTLFGHLQAEAPLIPVIVLTAHGTIPEAVAATQRGVFSYLTKPFDSQELLRRVDEALRLSPVLDPQRDAGRWRRDILTVNGRMEELLRQAHRVAEEGHAAHLLGPAGSGKSTLAQAIHRACRFADGPFVKIACTDYPVQELEAQFLEAGEANVFTRARNGVLYVQDIGALPLSVQGRLFAFLLSQSQARVPFQPGERAAGDAGGPQLQLLTSSPRPLDHALSEGSFRSDLFYFLRGCTLQVPGLSERPDDIPLLARHFLHAYQSDAVLSPEAINALTTANWPGNILQLQTVLRQAVAMSNTPTIPLNCIAGVLRETEEASLAALDDARREFESQYLVRLLKVTRGNVSQAARIAQRNRTEFYKLLARHGLDPVCFKEKLR